MPDEPRLDDPSRHWDAAYTARGTDGVSWFQDVPTVSLQLIEAMGIPPDAAVIDVGGGASGLVGRLVELGFSDLTVLDRVRTRGDSTAAWRFTCHPAP